MRKTKYLICGLLIISFLTGCGDSSGSRTSSDRTAKSDAATTDAAKRPDGLAAEITKEESKAKTENSVIREAGLYRSDGSFIPWDDLGINVETDHTENNYETDANSPYKVFRLHNNDGYLVLPANITKIGSYAFYDSTLESVDFSNTQITSIGKKAFYNCTFFANVDLPNTVTSIGDYAFYHNHFLTSIQLPDTLESIGDNAFGRCVSLESIAFPDSLTSIDREAFCGCSHLTSIDLSNTQITIIGDGVFRDWTSLVNVDLPNTITDIEARAFRDCFSLESIALPNTLTSIGDAFYFCSFTNIDYEGTMEEWNAIDKYYNWTDGSKIKTITCSDGVITL